MSEIKSRPYFLLTGKCATQQQTTYAILVFGHVDIIIMDMYIK